MAQSLQMARNIKRGGSAWRRDNDWYIRFDSSAIMDQILIRNTLFTEEKISMSLEEAEAFVDFIQEARRAFTRWKLYQEHPIYPFMDDDVVAEHMQQEPPK